MAEKVRTVVAYVIGALLVFVAASSITAQVVLLPRARAAVEKDLRAIYDPAELRVAWGSRPFVLDIATSRLPSMRVEMKSVDSGQTASAADRFITSVRLSSVSFELSNVHFARRKVLGGISAFEAETGEMKAVLEEGELNKFLEAEGYSVTVTITPGEVSATADVLGEGNKVLQISARASLELTGTSIALVPDSIDQKGVETRSARLALEAVVPVPPVAGIRATSIETAQGALVLRAPVTRLYGIPEESSSPTEGAPGADQSAAVATPTVPPGTASPSPTRPSPSPTRTSATRSPTPTTRRTQNPSPTRSAR